MEISDNSLDLHFFVCTNRKENNEGCAAKGSEALRTTLKEWCQSQPHLKSNVRINAAGCLGQCKKGIAITAHPHRKWIFNVKEDDLESLKRLIEELVAKPSQ